MKARFLARYLFVMTGVLLVVVAVLALAWIMGDTQQTRWIETPVAPPSAKAGS